MEGTLRKKLTISYVLVTIICVTIITILANIFLERQFAKYIMDNQEKKNQDIVKLLSNQYDLNKGWRSDSVENIGINALQNGLIIKVRDNAGKMIWNARVYNNGLCQDIILHMSEHMYSRYPNFNGEYKEDAYPVTADSTKVGTVEIGYYGPFFFTDSDIAFLKMLNIITIGGGVVTVLVALLIGSLMAKRISNPISRVINTSKMIEKGNYRGRVEVKSGIKEITELTETINNLASSLKKQEDLRKRLTGDVAHELRTPLATLQSHMEAMIDGIWEADERRLKSCHEEIVRISRLVGDLEKLTKYEYENMTLNKSNFDVIEIIKGILLNFQSQFDSKGIEVEFMGKEPFIINCDRDKISQVIINLISNSLKYTKEGGRVEIEVKEAGEYALLKVKDNGIGIPKEELPYIFERFYRVDKSRSRTTGGSGIGLTIVKTIVEAHGGTIEVHSSLNEGSEFIVKLPRGNYK